MLDAAVAQFFNAYALGRQDWYSQFVVGRMLPLPGRATADSRHRLGQGYFNFGVPGLRSYHTLFSRIELGGRAVAVVLRAVDAALPPQRPAKPVFLLPPSGDLFALTELGLHWHHICTTTLLGQTNRLDCEILPWKKVTGLDQVPAIAWPLAWPAAGTDSERERSFQLDFYAGPKDSLLGNLTTIRR